MAYDINRKIAKLLKEHSVEAEVTGLVENREAGIRVVSGSFTEIIQGVITRDKIADLAARIKTANG